MSLKGNSEKRLLFEIQYLPKVEVQILFTD